MPAHVQGGEAAAREGGLGRLVGEKAVARRGDSAKVLQQKDVTGARAWSSGCGYPAALRETLPGLANTGCVLLPRGNATTFPQTRTGHLPAQATGLSVLTGTLTQLLARQ